MENSKFLFVNEFADLFPDEISQILEAKDPHKVADIFENLEPEEASKLIGKFLPGYASIIVNELDSRIVAELLEPLNPHKISSIVRFLSDKKKANILKNLPNSQEKAIRLLLEYPQESVGAWMQTQVLNIYSDNTVEESLPTIKSQLKELSSLTEYIYVLDRDDSIKGSLKTISLFNAEPKNIIENIMENHDLQSISANSLIYNINEHAGWRKSDIFVVTSKEQKFIGILRHQDLVKANSSLKIMEKGAMINGNTMNDFSQAYFISLTELFSISSKIVFSK